MPKNRSALLFQSFLKVLLVLQVLFFLTLSCEATNWDIEYWQYLTIKNWESGLFKFYTEGELRINQSFSKVYYYRVGENFAYKALSWLDLEAHYNFIYHTPISLSDFIASHRFEIELNPSLRTERAELVWRNRFEWIKPQDNTPWQSVFRHRLKITFPIKNVDKLIAISCSDEVFYHWNLNKFTENRFIPCELSFQFSQTWSLEVFLMMRNLFAAEKWRRNLVWGSRLRF